MSVGVDTVGVAIPLSPVANKNQFEGSKERFALPNGGFVATGVGGMAWIEASLPKRKSGANVDALPVDFVPELVVELVQEALETLQVEVAEKVRIIRSDGTFDDVGPTNPRIIRLDLVRDFRLRDPDNLSPILKGLAGLPQNARHKIRRFDDGRSGKAETLRIGPGSWAATLYDKHRESGGLAPPGSLRAEFRLRSKQLSSQRVAREGATIRTLQDVTTERCDSLRRIWWDMVGFGSWVGGRDEIWTQLKDLGLSDRERIFFVGWIHARRDGISIEISDKTDRRFRRLLRGLRQSSENRMIRLNFESGDEELQT